MPWTTSSRILKTLVISGARMLPSIPVKITARTVSGPIPPSDCDTAMAMGVVMLLGRSDAVTIPSSDSRRHIA